MGQGSKTLAQVQTGARLAGGVSPCRVQGIALAGSKGGTLG